jgi:colanic acid biosynthesis glycosyl transferase WcaI
MMDKLRTRGVGEKYAMFFPNWANLDSINPLSAPSGFRAKLGISDETLVCLYSGSLARKKGIEIFPEIAKRLAGQQDIVLVVCGDGVGRAEMAAASLELCNMRFMPLQPLEKLNNLLNLADIQLLPQRADAADLVMPSKLGGILASGRPVVAGAMPGTEIASVVGCCGIVVPPDDAAAMTGAILRLAV